MGQSLFLDLRDILGDQEFIQSVRRLYRTKIRPHIESVKSAFPNSGDTPRVIKQHYYGEADPQSIKPPQAPTTELTSVRLRIEKGLRLPPWDKTPLRSFSASKYYGPIVLSASTPRGSQEYVTLTVEHAGSNWNEQHIIDGTGSRLYIGPKRTPWLPGSWTASVEQDGKKLAEISWTVTP